MITQTFDLNLIPDSAPVVVHCDQYDHGTGRLVISLYDGPIAYSPSGTAVIQGVKPDGHGFDYSCTLSGNVVTANLTEQMTAVAGQVRTQIVVTESTGRTGTFVFILDVQRSALPADTDMSESDYQLIEQAIEETQQAAEDAEAWAVGQRGGQDVPSTDPTYENNSKYWAEVAQQAAEGGLIYKGSCLFANIPTSGMHSGDMWNIEDDFITDSRFQEGSGKSVAAGSNIAWNTNNKWDVLAMVKVSSLNDLTNVDITSPSANDFLGYDPQSSEWKNIPISIAPMTASTLGIGKPDTITTTVDNSGTFSAKGVGIVADVNSGGTQYGNDWLYYTGTTTVITPESDKMYRVTISGTAYLYYWNGTAYAQLASSGGGGGASLVDVTTAQYNALTPAEKADANTWYWINDMDGNAGSYIVVGSLTGLTDTNISSPSNGQVLKYNSTSQKWENANESGGGGGVTSFNSRTGAVVPANNDYSIGMLSDVYTSTAASMAFSRFLYKVSNLWIECETNFVQALNSFSNIQPNSYSTQIADLSSYTDYYFTGEYRFENNDANLSADLIVSVMFNADSNAKKCKLIIYNPTSSAISISYCLYVRYFKSA